MPAPSERGGRAPGQGGGRGGRGPITPGRPFPEIDVVKSALVLTDAQAAAVAPLLDTDAKGIELPPLERRAAQVVRRRRQ